jgi:hypothetical protein
MTTAPSFDPVRSYRWKGFRRVKPRIEKNPEGNVVFAIYEAPDVFREMDILDSPLRRALGARIIKNPGPRRMKTWEEVTE